MRAAAVIAAVLILAAGIFGNYLRFAEEMPDRPPDFSAIPYRLEHFSGEERRFGEWSYEILQADTTTLRLYRGNEGIEAWLFIGYFESQKYGSQIHSPKHCLPGSGWYIESLSSFELPLEGDSKTVNRLLIREGAVREVMFYWFETRGGAVRDEFALKLDLAFNSLLFRPSDAAFVRLTLPAVDGDLGYADSTAVALLQELHPYLMRALPFSD